MVPITGLRRGIITFTKLFHPGELHVFVSISKRVTKTVTSRDSPDTACAGGAEGPQWKVDKV